METCRENLPFRARRKIHMIVRSNAIVIPLLAVSQGGGLCRFTWLRRRSRAALQGVLTCFATILPIVGTTLVWLRWRP